MNLEDVANIGLLVVLILTGGMLTVGILWVYVMMMAYANERD